MRKMIIYILLVFLLFIAYVRYLESTSLFYPAKDYAATPADVGLAFDDVYMTTADGQRIHGWFIKNASAGRTLLFLHGNAGNIGDRIGKINLFHQLGLNVLIIDYRGYGQSAGRPTENGMYLDALAAYKYLREQMGLTSAQIVVYGASLGGVAAVDLLSREKAAGVILDSTFTNAVDMAKKIYPFIPSFLIRIKLDSLRKIKTMTIPKLFIHSRDDELVPYELGMKLFEAAPLPKEFLTLSGGHNDGHINEFEQFSSGIAEFLGKL